MDNTKQEETWRAYPDYPFIQASNLGRIRTVDRIVTDRNGRKIHTKGRFLKQYLNKDGYTQVQIHVKGKYNKAKGFWFCYADGNAVERTRDKFGDEIANKVKKLMERNSLKQE